MEDHKMSSKDKLVLGITLFINSEFKEILENKIFFDFKILDNKTILLNIFLFLFLIISQNDILRFETIDSDINSYLVMLKYMLRIATTILQQIISGNYFPNMH